jgi:Chaperone of endosialidase
MSMGLFGGKKSSSVETNVNRDQINAAFGGSTAATGQSINALQALLGGDNRGFRAFADAIDLSGQAEYGSRGITGNAAARGLLRSGSTAKGIVNYENMLENQTADAYLQRLLGVGQLGLGAGELIAGAGREGRSSGKEKPGIGGFLGQVGAGFAASDERLKTNIVPVGKNRDGLTVYQYYYKDGSGPYTGVMAQEVAIKKPEALGPEVNGYMTVDYNQINVLDRV